MHPIERLRYVARSEGADPGLLVTETASALADVIRVEPVGLVPACRRLLDRHPLVGPMWWLASRVLSAADPAGEAWLVAEEIVDDRTADQLGACLGEDTTALVVGWPDLCAQALWRRGDVELLIAGDDQGGGRFARAMAKAGSQVSVVPDRGIAPAAAVCGVVLVEVLAGGPSGVIAAAGSHAAAAVASHSGVPVWGVTGVGRVLPGRLWDLVLERVDRSAQEPWERDACLVPASLLSGVIGPDGLVEVGEGLADPGWPAAPELLRNPG
jgi:hypothetical protein